MTPLASAETQNENHQMPKLQQTHRHPIDHLLLIFIKWYFFMQIYEMEHQYKRNSILYG